MFGDSNVARAIALEVILNEMLQEAIKKKVDFEDEFFVSGIRVSSDLFSLKGSLRPFFFFFFWPETSLHSHSCGLTAWG